MLWLTFVNTRTFSQFHWMYMYVPYIKTPNTVNKLPELQQQAWTTVYSTGMKYIKRLYSVIRNYGNTPSFKFMND